MKKKRFTRSLAALLSALLVLLSLPMAVSAADTGAVTTTYVNFRKGPSTSTASQAVLPTGTAVTVTDTSRSDWYGVRTADGRTGYIYAIYLRVTNVSGGTPAKTTAYVNLRAGASTSTAVQLVVPQNATVTILEQPNTQWYKVSYNGRVGYLFAQYVKPSASVTPKPTATAKPTAAPTATAKPTTAPTPSGAKVGKTTAYVNLRAGAGTNHNVYLTVPLGASITVLDTSNSSWYRVSYQSYTGYMSAQYIQVTGQATATPAPTPTPASIGTAVTTAVLNIRSGPSTGYNSLGLLAYGTKVTVVEKAANNWYRVRTAANVYGYCSGDWLRVTMNSTPTPTPKPTAAPTANPTAKPTTAPTPAATTAQGKTTTDVNLRREAGTWSGVLRVLDTNTAVTVLEKTDSHWYKVKLGNGTTGYLASQYVKLTSGSDAALPKPAVSVADAKAKAVLDSVGHDLRAAYNWASQKLPYKTPTASASGYVHSDWYANWGFTNKSGNCYVMAATFYKMAKQLGYDAHYVEGAVLTNSGGQSPHGWVEIDMEGTTYVFDPDFQHEYGRNGYKFKYGTSGTFRYVNYKRVP